MSSSEGCCRGGQCKIGDSEDAQCKCKTYIKDNTCTAVIDCCGEKSGVQYCICVCRCGDKTCVGIIDCTNDAPLEQELEQLKITNGEEVASNSKCFAKGDICVAVIDCCQNLGGESKNCVCVVKCNGRLFKPTCSAKQFRCKCKCSEDCSVEVDCKKEGCPKKCVIVSDCGEKGISVSVREGSACGKLEEGDHNNCECNCYIDKGICVAVVKC